MACSWKAIGLAYLVCLLRIGSSDAVQTNSKDAVSYGSVKVDAVSRSLQPDSSAMSLPSGLTTKDSEPGIGPDNFHISYLKSPNNDRAVIKAADKTISVPAKYATANLKDWTTNFLRENGVAYPETYKLYQGDKELTDTSTLNLLGVPAGGLLEARQTSSPKVNLKIAWQPDRRTLDVQDVSLDGSLVDLKKSVATIVKLQPDDILLLKDGKLLQPESEPLKSLGVTADANLSGDLVMITFKVSMPDGDISQFTTPRNGTVSDLLNLCRLKDPKIKSLTSQNEELPNDRQISVLDTSHIIKAVSSDEPFSLGSASLPPPSIGDSAPPSSLSLTNSLGSHKMTLGDLTGQCPSRANGPASCGLSEEAVSILETWYWRESITGIVFVVLLIWVVIIIQTIVRKIVNSLMAKEDKYMRELVEVTFRQVSVIALSCALLRMLTTINGIENGLDKTIFASVYKIADVGEEGLLTEVFVSVQNMVDNYLLIYVAYVLFFVVLAYSNFRWLNKAEDLTVEQIVTHHPKSAYLDFVVARYEYMDRIAGRDIPSLDPKGCWFMEYYRACLLNTAITLIRVPNITLIIFQFLIWALLPLSRLYRIWAIIAYFCFMAVPVGMLSTIMIRIFFIKRNVLPEDPVRYATLRYQLESSDSEIDETGLSYHEALMQNAPRYKLKPLNHKEQGLSDFKVKYLYGTRYPNKHESLFYWRRKGPSMLLRLAEASFLMAMMSTAWLLNQFDRVPELWFSTYKGWPWACAGVAIILVLSFVPFILYDLTFISSTGMLLKENILSDVLISNRSLFVRRLSYFVDGIRSEALLRHIRLGGAAFLDTLRGTCESGDEETQRRRQNLWETLTAEGEDEITPPVLFAFLNAQGLNIYSEKSMDVWFGTFSRDGSARLVKEEFDMLSLVLTELLRESLELESVRSLLVDEWGVDADSAEAITPSVLDTVLSHLNMKWSKAQERHLITFMARDGSARKLSLDFFLSALAEAETTTLGTLNQAAQRMRADGGHRAQSGRPFEEPELSRVV